MAYKYPYIPKEYYAAVMYACKLVRDTGYKNQAIKRAAKYYGVDEDEVRKHFDARNAAGAKKRATKTKGRKYKYFVVGVYYGCDAQGETGYPNGINVFKGISKCTVENRFLESDLKFDMRNDTGSAYSPYRYHKVLSEHTTEAEAIEAAKSIKLNE